MREYNYWQRLERLSLYSLERRRERYLILYVWKVLSDIAPNISNDDNRIRAVHHIRRGRICMLPRINYRALASVVTLKESSFAVYAPRLFNELPIELRNFSGQLDVFKRMLDKFLSSVPDQPSMPNYPQPSPNNTLIAQISQMRLTRG